MELFAILGNQDIHVDGGHKIIFANLTTGQNDEPQREKQCYNRSVKQIKRMHNHEIHSLNYETST